jgi:hypothetical protein
VKCNRDWLDLVAAAELHLPFGNAGPSCGLRPNDSKLTLLDPWILASHSCSSVIIFEII